MMHNRDANPYLSEPIDIEFMGLRSDTYTMQKAGWAFSCEYEQRNMTYNLYMKHRDQMCGIALHQRIYDYHTVTNMPPVIHMGVIGKEIYLNSSFRGRRAYPVDMTPTPREAYFAANPCTDNYFPMEYLCIFKPVDASASNTDDTVIAIEDRSVADLLGIIKDRYPGTLGGM